MTIAPREMILGLAALGVALFGGSALVARGRMGHWREIGKEELLRLLPFWDERTCQRISASLRDKGVIGIDSAPLDQSDRLRFNLDAVAREPAPAASSSSSSSAKLTGGKTLMAERWRPDAELLRQLALHGITAAFAEAQVEEFVAGAVQAALAECPTRATDETLKV